MTVLLRIAWRNLREHKSKTIIVGVLVALGVLLLVVGNSLLATAAAGTRVVFIENFTGHVMVRAKSDTPVSIAGATGFSMEDFSGPRLPHYPELYDYVSRLDGVRAVNPQVPFFARMDYSTPEQNKGAFVPVFGIEPESYLRMFPDAVTILDGRFLEPNEQGLVLHRVIRDQVRDQLEITINVGDRVKLQSMSQAGGMRIREVPVIGLYEFAIEAPAMDGMAFMDVHTVRDLAGMVVGTTDVVPIDEADTALLDTTFDFDDLFADPFEEETTVAETAAFDPDALFDDGEAFDLYSRIDSGAWSYILLMLDDTGATDATIQTINERMAELGWAVEAVGWDDASGGMATFVQAFQILFLAIVGIVTVVSIIIIMNTLVISVVERTAEIGTMRALGARKSAVRRMFVLETMCIAVAFGAVGMIVGLLLLGVLRVVGLPAPNAFFEILFGGSVLRPVFSPVGIYHAILMMLGVGFLSSLYPVSVALRIRPVQAMQAE